MKILIVGASGRVGTLLTHRLLKMGHKITGTSSHSNPPVNSPDYTHLTLDITQELKQLEEKISDDFEAVYFVAGSSADSLLQIDLHGAVKIMQLTERKLFRDLFCSASVFHSNRRNGKKKGLAGLPITVLPNITPTSGSSTTPS